MATVTTVTRRARGKVYTYHGVRFTDPGTGKERIRYFPNHREAKRALIEIESRTAAGTYAPDAHRITVREIAERCVRRLTRRAVLTSCARRPRPITRLF